MLRLNLGCANDILDGYVNIDIHHKNPKVLIEDVKNLHWLENNSVDTILAKDVLEHLSFSEGLDAIKEWSRVLKQGGSFYIQTINLPIQIEAFQEGVWDLSDFNHMVFAGVGWVDGITRPGDFHKSAYTFNYLEKILNEYDLFVNKKTFDTIDDMLRINSRSHNLNMNIWGIKK
tara:strand:+ start:2823 stop:3344 length:522 start_codon:yes stop_codon:yes gene_type:complete